MLEITGIKIVTTIWFPALVQTMESKFRGV